MHGVSHSVGNCGFQRRNNFHLANKKENANNIAYTRKVTGVENRSLDIQPFRFTPGKSGIRINSAADMITFWLFLSSMRVSDSFTTESGLTHSNDVTSACMAKSTDLFRVTSVSSPPTPSLSALPTTLGALTLASVAGTQLSPAIRGGLVATSMLPIANAQIPFPSGVQWLIEKLGFIKTAGDILISEAEQHRIEKIQSNVERIASSEDISAARLKNIKSILIENELNEFKDVPFERKMARQSFGENVSYNQEVISGTNLVVDINEFDESKPTIVLSAHLDRVPEGTGAWDNGSGCVALIEAGKHFRNNPVDDYNIQLVFFDAEETGLHGSSRYVHTCLLKNKCPTLLINVDMVGRGDHVLVSGQESATNYYVMDEESRGVNPDEQRFIDIFTAAFANNKTVINNGAAIPSDHLPFQREGQPAVGVTQISLSDAKNLLAYQQENRKAYNAGGFYENMTLEELDDYSAKVDEHFRSAQDYYDKIESLALIHTTNDRPEVVNATKIANFIDVFTTAIRTFADEKNASETYLR